MMATELRTIRILPFDGRNRNWDPWSEKTYAKAKRRGWKKLLVGGVKIPTESEYEQAVADKNDEVIKIGGLNEEAYEELVLCMDHTTDLGRVAFSLVKNSKSADYPEGNCKIAWDRLMAKYAPKTAPSLLKLKKKFANSRLVDLEKNPDEWITELEGFRTDMEDIHIATTMSDLDFLIHVLNNLPDEYDVVLDGMEERLMLKDSDPKKLTIGDMRDKLNNRFERLKGRLNHAKEKDDMALYANFKGNCTKCGKQGHKGTGCPNNRIVCWHCGKGGHIRSNCDLWKKVQAERQQDNKNEMANVAVEDNESFDELGF